ncbi:4'-phosphopantetheinyl transferase family protein [Thiolapillus sp.]|uniref:4'-phosphopantetheinyl transferase family protein n=1 Tax=Thiolapillus sp. TaxID=2017437 RepID=UPI003AF71EA6
MASAGTTPAGIHIPHWSEGSFDTVNRLRPGEVHIWRFDLDQPTSGSLSILSSEERSRFTDIRRPEAARRYLNSRLQLRGILASYLDEAPARLSFIVRPGGKPELARLPVHFNLSHSHELGLLAISALHPVGIDLEKIRDMKYPSRIARRTFSTEVWQQWSAPMAGENQQLLFFRQWTALEARQKAFGYGIFATPVPPDDLHCRHFFAADGFVAALATPSSHDEPALRFFNSPPTAYDAA